MLDGSTILRVRQSAVRREMDRRGLSMKVLSLDSGIPLSTLGSYFPQEGGSKTPALITMAAVFQLCGHLPDEILSLLLPDNRRIVMLPDGLDLDDFEGCCREFLESKARAHHKDSPAGRELSDGERQQLNSKRTALAAAA